MKSLRSYLEETLRIKTADTNIPITSRLDLIVNDIPILKPGKPSKTASDPDWKLKERFAIESKIQPDNLRGAIKKYGEGSQSRWSHSTTLRGSEEYLWHYHRKVDEEIHIQNTNEIWTIERREKNA